MSLVASARGEAVIEGGAPGDDLVTLCASLLCVNRLLPSDLVALRIGCPDRSFPREGLHRMGIRRIPIFWEEAPKLWVELHARVRRKRRLRSLPLPGKDIP